MIFSSHCKKVNGQTNKVHPACNNDIDLFDICHGHLHTHQITLQLTILYFQPDLVPPVDDDPGSAVARGPQRHVLHRQPRGLGQEVELSRPLPILLVTGISPE